jgi:cardiolipin synthase
MQAPAATPAPWFSIGDDKVRLLRDGAEAFPAMLAAIRAAKREVLLEMYWVAADQVGERFLRALTERARAGVTVRVIYDAVGSLGLTDRFWAPLLDAGGDVREYHTLLPFRPGFTWDRIGQRDHRKVLLCDSTRGFVGGLNLAMHWLPASEGGLGWRDDVVEIDGLAALELRTLFYKTWRRLTHRPKPSDLLPLRRKRTRGVWMLSSLRSRRSIRREYLLRINEAKKSVDIANSYFIPDRRVRSALFRAIVRGARVRVVVPANSDVQIVQFAQEALFDAMLRHGVELYVYPDAMMHAKTAIIDERFCTIGSYNLDQRSWRKNLEINVAVEDEAFAKHVRASFERDVAVSRRVDLRAWRDRSLARRGVEWLAFALRDFW